MLYSLLTTAATEEQSVLFTFVLPLVLMIAMLYLLLYRPQQKQNKKDAEMRNSMDIGDEVTTIGGIIGRVVSIKDDTFVLETGSDRVKLRFARSAVASLEKLKIETGSGSEKKTDKK